MKVKDLIALARDARTEEEIDGLEDIMGDWSR